MEAGKTAPLGAAEVLAADPRIGRILLAYAFKKTRDRERTQEVAQDAIARVLAGRGWCRWDPDRKSLLNHLSDVVESLVANQNRRASVNRERPMAEDDEEAEPDSSPSPEQRFDSHEQLERKRRLAARVMERVAEDRIIPRMLECEQEGIDQASELASRLDCSVKDIYRARERLAYHRDQVLEEERKLEEERVKGRAMP
jgi:DNA-directed RNA polymerase specialized sigma24 family protein